VIARPRIALRQSPLKAGGSNDGLLRRIELQRAAEDDRRIVAAQAFQLVQRQHLCVHPRRL
jgi:hypothetical protein